jgi:hypothetical protein
MTFKLVRAPNSSVLIVVGMALLLFGTMSIERAVLNANPHHFPVVVLAEGGIKDAVFGVALLYVALRKSQFAGATAVIIATFLTFGVVFSHATSLAFGLSDHITWWDAVYPAIAASILGLSLFPWSQTTNKPALFLMGLTFATLTFLVGSLALLARI